MNTFLRYSRRLYYTGILSACLALATPFLHAAEQQAAGRVIQTAGDVTATSAAGMRLLVRGDEIFVGDIITTGPTSFAQLRFIDSAIVALKADTAFEITEYVYEEPNGADDRATMSLIEGGLRTITGSIGKDDPDAYRVVTPFATIGIRGTDHEEVITPEGLLTGVFDGGITVENESGFIDLGIGASYDFAMVTDIGTPPLGLTQQPPELDSTLTFVEEDEENEEAGEEEETTSDEAAEEETAEEELVVEEESSNEEAGDEEISTEIASASDSDSEAEDNPNQEDDSELTVVPPTNVAALDDEDLSGQELDGDDNQASINPHENGDGSVSCNSNSPVCQDDEEIIEPEPEPEPELIAALTQAEESSLSRTAAALLLRNDGRLRFSGQAGVDANNNDGGKQNTALLANDNTVLRYAGSRENFQQNVGGYDIEWGIWRDSSQTPITEQNRQDRDDISRLNNIVLMLAAVSEVTPSFTGRKNFAATDNFLAIAGGNGNSVSGVDGHLAIDLATADVEGAIGVTVDTDQGVSFWNGVVTGALQHQDGRLSGMYINQRHSFVTESADSQAPSAEVRPRRFKGDINGTFTGEEANALLLDFNFWETRDRNHYVTGFSLFEQVDADSPDNPPEIDWGVWDMPVLENWGNDLLEPTREHLADKYQTSDIMLRLFELAKRSYDYEAAGGFGQGFGQKGGALSDVQANFSIDFNTGDISNGQLMVTDANFQNWAVAFDGTLASGDVSLSALPGTFTIDEVANTGEATLGGAFTGVFASGFTGAFELIDGNESSRYVQGVFDLSR